MKNKIVLTKMAGISSLGDNIDVLWSNIMEYKHGLSPLELQDSKTKINIAGQIKNLNIPKIFQNDKDFLRLDRFQQLSLLLAEQILDSSHIGKEIPVFMGVGMCGVGSFEDSIKMQNKKSRIMPFDFLGSLPSLGSGIISTRYKLKGANYTISSACASGTHSLINGAMMIQLGLYEKVIVGGVESIIRNSAIGGFASIKAISSTQNIEESSIPFSEKRSGFIMSEGGGLMILQTEESAIIEGAEILAELKSYSMNSDGSHITKPCGEGAYRCMKQALVSGGIHPEEITYINAHATSTPIGDLNEAEAIYKLFGAGVPVFAPKGYIGHLLGGAGAIENVLCVKSILKNTIPANISKPASNIPIKILEEHRNQNIKYVLNNNFGFGGTNASIVWSKYIKD